MRSLEEIYRDERKDKPSGTAVTPLSYFNTAKEIGAIVDKKNTQYGDAINNTGKILAVLYPNGIKPEQYHEIGTIVRILDKLFRIAKGDQGEESAWSDIAGYAILMIGKK